VLTADEQERFRSLGYVNYSDNTPVVEAPDPKDKLDELKMIRDAEEFEFEGNFQAAADLHQKMLSLRPRVAASYDNLALAQARTNNFDAAIQTLKQGLEKILHSEILLSRLGHTYLVAGRTDEALTAMAEVLKINPQHIDALAASALALGNMGKKEEAREYFERALAVDPGNKFVLTSYANFLAVDGKIPEAVEIFTRLTQDFPQDDKPFQLLGITYGMIGDYDKAIENLKKAASIKPSPSSYYYLAISLKEKGDFAEAVRYLELYLEDPKGETGPRIKKAQATLEHLKKLLNK
jgi:tetratricopeptide (TPR) repeat protein